MTTKRILAQTPTVFTASGLVYTGPCILQGFTIGTDGANDPEITFYNSLTASGTKVIPTVTYDASALGINGVTGIHQYCDIGLYVEIDVGAGAVEVIPQYIPYHYPEELSWPIPGRP
jgi:acyl-[acyl carrier protein]--UDP-N-acetylglucosamine O-acyltransferase